VLAVVGPCSTQHAHNTTASRVLIILAASHLTRRFAYFDAILVRNLLDQPSKKLAGFVTHLVAPHDRGSWTLRGPARNVSFWHVGDFA
jgi:hypothetical protein